MCIICFCLHEQASASAWLSIWIQATEHCEMGNFTKAEELFSVAIEEMEKVGDLEHPHLYVDRGRLYLLLEKEDKALADLNKAIDSDRISYTEKIRAIVTRIMVRARLGMESECLSDLKLFNESNVNKPTTEITDKYIIIRNAPSCECYLRLLSGYFIQSGICQSEDDITVMKSDIILIKRAVGGCGCVTPEVITPCGPAEDCKAWCDRAAVLAAASCAKIFSKWRCQAACMAAVNELQNWCHGCCNSGAFYRYCIKPITEDLLKYVGEGCDPLWD